MKTRDKIQWGLFIALLVTVLIMIPTFILLDEEGGFTNPDYRWESTPVSVSCAGYTPADDGACDAAGEAVSRFNVRTRNETLVWTEDVGQIHIVMRAPVHVNAEEMDEPGGHYDIAGNAGRYEACRIYTMNVSGGASDLELLTVYHELGHCMGLAHDPDNQQSIMRPVQSPTARMRIGPWLSDHDAALIRARYHP
jgi:hypothetical protein